MGEPAALRLLLDTHIWLWSLLEPDRISPRLRRMLERAENDLWLSPISLWEALLLVERGRIVVAGEPADWVQGALRAMPVRDATLTREVAIASRAVDLPHEDPGDRFIAASAMVHDLSLATSDERLLGSRHYRSVGNR